MNIYNVILEYTKKIHTDENFSLQPKLVIFYNIFIFRKAFQKTRKKLRPFHFKKK